ncbi:MAG: 4-hydroxy-3-methylbut-2-enyl diphosphate reductase, partial [Candidatus Omnitrophota bacterium]|nr:4-hydroxy-3-methylbut-2-enyl diphosphate reductase [Candidatus Omnitrophota bacterium]
MSLEKVILSKPRGFCAGVERAIEVVEQALARFPGPVYVRKEIVHNPHVVNALRQKGAVFVEELTDVPPGATTIFSAHGVSPAVHEAAHARTLKVIDATCPLVTKVHVEAKRFAQQGYTLLLIGHAGHEEVAGTMGEAPEEIQLIQTVEEARTVRVADPEKVAVITQTTLSVDDTRAIVDALRARFPALVAPSKDDICYATQNRQNAVKAIAKEAEVILVIGAKNSSNSIRLTEVAEDAGRQAYLI